MGAEIDCGLGIADCGLRIENTRRQFKIRLILRKRNYQLAARAPRQDLSTSSGRVARDRQAASRLFDH